MLTAEITNIVYENFITLNQGFSIANNGAWLLLLNKVMGMVAELKNLDLTRDDRINLVVAVVIRYLDEKTDISDDQLQHITTSVRAMCLAMLGYGGELAGKQPSVSVPNDPELVSTPLRITQLLMDKIRELVRREPNATENLGAFFPQIVMLCITTVNKFRNLTNLEKRNLVIDVINSFLDEYLAPRLTTPHQQISLGLFKADLGNMVDLFVGIAKGKSEYNFNYHDPVRRRNLLTCLGTGIVRAVAVLGLCFIRRQPATTESSKLTTLDTVPTNTKTTEHQLHSTATVSNIGLPSIPEETISTLDEIVDNTLPLVFITEQRTNVQTDELFDADESLPPTPPSKYSSSEIEHAPPFPDCSDHMSIIQVIIDTVDTDYKDQYIDSVVATNNYDSEQNCYPVDLYTTSEI